MVVLGFEMKGFGASDGAGFGDLFRPKRRDLSVRLEGTLCDTVVGNR